MHTTQGFSASPGLSRRPRWLAVALLTLALLPAARPDVRLPALFTDHMVLQQGLDLPVWGWADEGERVTVTFRGQEKTATAAAGGRWEVRLKPLKASAEPAVLTVAGKNRLEVKDVLVGEVWICSGQSNMQWPMSAAYEPAADIAAAANPLIRLFYVPRVKSQTPLTDVKATWQECTPATVKEFSAVAYYFGRSLEFARRVPIGLVHTSWGGSPAEVWIRQEVLAANPEYRRDLLDAGTAAYQRWEEAKAEAARQGKNPPGMPWRPCELYNGMIAPLLPFAIRGAIWYQGESNAGRAWQYRTLFADMIRNWRQDWGQGDFTFLAVQLAPWDFGRKRTLEQITAAPGDSAWAELREAQNLATHVLPKVGVAVITDVGDKDDIHPKRKEPVGQRLARLARAIAYGEKIVPTGPLYKGMRVEGDRVILAFNHVGEGLEARGGDLTGFAIAGADQKFVWARAEVQGRTVVVSSPQVPQPVAVRYGWADFPVVNLYNSLGLPASPFRTDDFPPTTKPKS